jgi:predicted DNA-binding antitoxin AbrB/MazE fold protein
MANTIEAIYDGSVFHPSEPPELAPNSRVLLVIQNVLSNGQEPTSVLDVAISLNLDGPADWSRNIDSYLYGTPDEEDAGKDGPGQ